MQDNRKKQRVFTIETRKGMVNILLLFAFLCLLIYFAKPLIEKLPSINIPCLMHLFGFNCPFCGGTRCAGALLNFDIKTAFYYNPMVVIVAVFFAFYLIWCLISCLKKDYRPPRLKIGNTGIYIIIGIILLFTVVRNLPFYRDILY